MATTEEGRIFLKKANEFVDEFINTVVKSSENDWIEVIKYEVRFAFRVSHSFSLAGRRHRSLRTRFDAHCGQVVQERI